MANNSSWKDEGSLNFILNNPGYQKAQAKYNEEHGIQNSNEAGNISLPAPYAILIEPYEKGNKTNVSNSGDNYQKTLNAYNEAKRRLIDQTDEARDIKDTWSATPRVTLENGNLMLNGTRKFLDSDTGKELQKTLKDMEGQTYNSEDLNKQIEAWNATLSKMADEYSKAAESLNIANAALADTAGNAEYHKLTLSDLQKVSNSATIGKGADARTSKKKIFVGFEWDDDGNLIERWVEAKKFFEEFNSVDDDEKRRAYRDLIVQANNGDVGAYSKLMYLNGGAEGKPANVEYNAVGDFFHTLGEHLLVGLSEAADFVTTYVPIFNTSRLTSRVVNAAESGDINEFFAPDETRKMIDSYKETLSWEDAYLSELTPGSTALAAQTGNVVGNLLGMAYSIWAGGVGNSAAATMVTQGINKANQALLMTGNFTAFERTAVAGAQNALGGAVKTTASTSQFLMPTAVVEKFPKFSAFLADKALTFSQYTGVGLTGTSMGDMLSGAGKAGILTENTVTVPGGFKEVANGATIGLNNNVTATVVSNGMTMSTRSLVTLTGKALASEQMFSKGLQTAFRLAPLAGETVLRTTDQYFQKVYMGEDPGDMTEYIINNTAEALVWGGAFMAAGAKIRELKQIARAARQSPASATAGAYNRAEHSQSGWCAYGYREDTTPQKVLTPGMEIEKDIQGLISSVVTANGESFFISPNRTPVATGYEGSAGIDGGIEAVPTSIEFAPIPNSAGESGAAFGAASAKKITKYEVEKTLSGADLIETAIDVETGTTTTTRRHFDTLEAANDAAKTASVPKASPRTIANSDALQGANVAPLSVNGEVLPKVDGVTQVKVQRGIIYRTPDDMVEDLANIAGAEGWSAANQDRLYREYQQYVEEARSAQENALHVQEAPDYPKDIVGTDVEMYLRTAAWAKANGYNLVPLRVSPVRTSTIKKFSTKDKFVQGLIKRFNFPEISTVDMAKAEDATQYQIRTATENGPLEFVVSGEIPENEVQLAESGDGTIPDSSISDTALGLMNEGKYVVTVNDAEVPVEKHGDVFTYSLGEEPTEYVAHIPAGTRVTSLAPTDGQKDDPLFSNGKVYVFDGSKGYTEGGTVAVKNDIGTPEERNGRILDRIKIRTGVDLRALPFKLDESSLDVTRMLNRTPGKVGSRSLMEYYDADGQGQRGAVVLMTPNEYLSALERFGNMSREVYEDIRDDSDTKKYTEDMANGDKFPMPAIAFDENGYAGKQEGRHRAFAAINNGIERIPVAIKFPANKGVDEVLKSNGFIMRPIDGGFYDITNEISRIVTNNDPEYGEVAETPTSKEIFLRKPDGSVHKPSEQYEFSAYSQPYDWSGDFSGRIHPNFEKLGKEILAPTNKKVESTKDVVEGGKSLYDLLDPFGDINNINSELRKNKHNGELPRDTVKNRTDSALESLDRLDLTFPPEGSAGDQGETVVSRMRAANRKIDSVISTLDNFTGHSTWYTFETAGSRLDNAVQLVYSALGKISISPERAEILRENVDPDYQKKVWDYVFDVENIRDEATGMVLDAFSGGNRNPDLSGVKTYLEKSIKELAAKHSKKLGSSKKDYGDIARLIDKNLRKGTHSINLPKGQKYLWTTWGATMAGNAFGSPEDVTDDLRLWEPGYHGKTIDIRFGTMNPTAAIRYARTGQMGEPSDSYVVFDGHPNNTGLIYYGDEKMFPGLPVGDRHAETNYWVADGGRVANAYGEGYTVVSKRFIGKNATGGDVYMIVRVMDDANGKPYSGDVDTVGTVKVTERVREDEVIEEENKFLVTQYGVPERWFQNKEEAMDYAERMGERAVYEIDDSADALERPPVTVDNLKALQPGEPLLKLSAGGYPTEAIRRFNELMIALPTLESPEDYTRGVIDIVYQVQAIYNQVAVNVDIASIYENYGKAIAEGREPEAMSVEMEALRPLLQVFDALGHYFDPSGKSLTQKFYLPTMLKPNKKVNILDAILGKDDVVDVDNPVDGGLDDILLDPTRVGDSGFWQQRSGDLFRDAEGNFTMDKAAPLEDAVVAYTVSALTRGKNKLYVAAQNEVARSKFDRNRAQITSKQALAGLKDADTVRTKAKAFQANISKDAEALAELKENYSGDESVIDRALEEKNYADELDYTRSVNTMAQKLGFNQFMQMNNIPGTAARFGSNSTGFRGIANIRRKLEKINVTGTMWVERFGEKVNVGFGLEPTPSNQQIYGSFKPEKAINLGQLINMNFDSDRAAVVFLNQINEKIATWSEGDGWDLMATISEFARENFPLSDSEWYTAQLMKKLGQNYNSFHDPEEIFIANAEAISGWITRGTLDTFNKAIQMSNISNLDNRTIRALDEAAAYMLIGTPVKRSKIINYAQEAAVWSALGLNPRVAIGNMLNEPLRLIDVVGYRGFAKAWSTALNPKEAARINSIISDLPSRFDNPEMVGLAEKAKGTFGKLKEKAASVALSPLEKSEQFKNILFWAAAEDNARARFPGDPKRQLQETLRFFNDYAIAGGKGTVPGVATGSFGRTLNIFKTFTLRNFDDFIDYVQKVARGESGNNYWDNKYEKKHGGKNYKDKTGRNKFDPKIAARVIGGRVFRSYLFWLLVGSYFGKSFTDALGGDPSGITDGGFDRGLYDDPDTDEYEGMTGFDEFINSLPAGFILGFLQDVYFAARRRGVESKQFLGFDIMNDPRFTKSLESKLPLGVAKNRFADMLDLVDRGYSFSSTGRKTYAAPETAVDTIKGFLFGKATTQNSLAYGKYRYGMVDVWGDLSSGDWMDFAMNANPFNGGATFDTARKDYTGVFNGGWNDVSTMQLIIQQFRERNKQIIADFQKNKYRYRGEYEGLTDEEKLAKAKEQREKDIDAFTDDVTRAVDAFEKAGNTLNDNQITNIMYLFDFHEGEEDEEWNSSYARKRYVEAGLPDYNAAAIERGEKTVDGEKQEVTKGMLDRSLVLENAQQGFYGSSKEAANAVKTALKDFKSVYKEYNTRVKALNEKYFEARKKNKKSAETKQLNKDIEALQNEYLDRLYNQLSPVVEQYGTALIGTYDVADVLEEYMGNMIPYSSIKKYGQTYSSGNDIVYGQLTEWLQKRWGRNGPTAPSDKEVTSGIEEIRNLLDQGKTASARSKARAILEKIGRGSLGARRDDVETLRDYAYD